MLKKIIKLMASSDVEDKALASEYLKSDRELFKKYTAIVYLLGEVIGQKQNNRLSELLEVNSESFFFDHSDRIYRDSQNLIYDHIKDILDAK